MNLKRKPVLTGAPSSAPAGVPAKGAEWSGGSGGARSAAAAP